jgi:hypothetical protein
MQQELDQKQDLEQIFGTRVPTAFVKSRPDTRAFVSSLPSLYLEYLKLVLASGIPVFTEGMEDTSSNIRERGDYRKRSAKASGMVEAQDKVSWQPASGLRRHDRTFFRLHGLDIGEPGFLVPVSASVLVRKSRQGVKGYVEIEKKLEPGTFAAAFSTRSRSGTGTGKAMMGMVGAGSGYMCGRLLRNGIRIGEGVYRINTDTVADTETVLSQAHSAMAQLQAVAAGVEVVVYGPALEVAEHLFRHQVPISLYFCDSRFWDGMGQGLMKDKNADLIQIRDKEKAATISRLLYRSGFGYRVKEHVFADFVRFSVSEPISGTSMVWKKVVVEKVEVPFSISIPVTGTWLVHSRGLVFRIPAL